MLNRFAVITAVASVLLMPSVLRADTANKTQYMNKVSTLSAVTQESTQILLDLNHANEMEIQMGELAQKNGASQRVKEFGAKLESDHEQAQDATENVAKQLGVSLPDDDVVLTSTDHKEHEKLAAMKGAQFDRAFLASMRDAHDKNIAKLEAAQNSTSLTGPVKDLVAQILPVLREHKASIAEIYKTVSNSKS